MIKHDSSNEWVVFLHGMGGSSAIWFKQIREYRKHFNVLLIDLPGHGGSTEGLKAQREPSFESIAQEVIGVLNHIHIKQAHFVGISLGTITARAIEHHFPDRVKTMVLGGAVEHIPVWICWLARIVNRIEFLIPYMWLYQLCAWALMPRNHHKESRKAFIKEAVRLGHAEFFCWFELLYRQVNSFFATTSTHCIRPRLYVMGSEDYMFLPYIKQQVSQCHYSQLSIIRRCGHVCNIEQETAFNEVSIDFITQHENEYGRSKSTRAEESDGAERKRA